MLVFLKSFFLRSPAHQSASWLSISLDAALGCRTNVFQIHRSSTSKKSNQINQNNHYITIHPQAAPLVCRHVLDTLISLAKAFPHHLIAEFLKEETKSSSSSSYKEDFGPVKSSKEPEFWEVLVKLDSLNTTKKGKNTVKSHSKLTQLISLFD
jgi:E3 ubiquitin-protein ligase HUWE1